MSFAPYYNDPVLLARPEFEPLAGQFMVKDGRVLFEFAKRSPVAPDAAVWPDLPHKVFVVDGFRFARVLKSVAYVAVDEAADGSPILEKWSLKSYRKYEGK